MNRRKSVQHGKQRHRRCGLERAQLAQMLDLAEDSSIVFMRVNSKCAHQVRPPSLLQRPPWADVGRVVRARLEEAGERQFRALPPSCSPDDAEREGHAAICEWIIHVASIQMFG